MEREQRSYFFSKCFNAFKKNLLPNFHIARCDAPKMWRTSMGGTDPATPQAESCINFHNHTVTYMVFIMFTVLLSLKR
ncbi:conserved Plasmodium protein, unknown function [Plasmodium vinckei]|uniref:Transmembrane protein n=3 Tax=Plasmodium vinckei TaxID=5860 RepID=A0A6V7T211_PLAVN|nr:conserved Plasmodium protein, unknown function [Plasmodium vinckei brucechwatti]CAD2105216.1 conserved Plasmodium protein, unknown function [Plasmodium vinckei]CAD2105307.1 conserved Plasmodium protein, unknown function [Plasmodium vinckei petteri]